MTTAEELLRITIKALERQGQSLALYHARETLFFTKMMNSPAARFRYFERLQRMNHRPQ